MAKESRSDATYEVARTYFKAALEHMVAAGRDVREFVEFALEKSGEASDRHLRRFLSEVREGHIAVQGLTESARQAVFGRQIIAEQRQAMIREAAYLRAERRGFSGGSPEDDWLAAEREVDERLLQQTGLLGSGRQALASAASGLEEELGSVKDIVSRWLESRSGTSKETEDAATAKPPSTKTAATKPAAAKPTASKPTATKPAAAAKAATAKATAPKPTATKPAATKPAVTKPAVTKPAVTKPAVTKPAVTKSAAAAGQASKAAGPATSTPTKKKLTKKGSKAAGASQAPAKKGRRG
jgi:hypothetical protein